MLVQRSSITLNVNNNQKILKNHKSSSNENFYDFLKKTFKMATSTSLTDIHQKRFHFINIKTNEQTQLFN